MNYLQSRQCMVHDEGEICQPAAMLNTNSTVNVARPRSSKYTWSVGIKASRRRPPAKEPAGTSGSAQHPNVLPDSGITAFLPARSSAAASQHASATPSRRSLHRWSYPMVVREYGGQD